MRSNPAFGRRTRQTAALALCGALVSACTASGVLSLKPEVDVGTHTSAVAAMSRPVPSSEFVAGYPRFTAPFSQPTMPADEVDCRKELKRLGVTYEDLPPISDGAYCGIEHPVKVSALSGGIEIKPAATLSCEMAATFALWTKKELAPTARTRFFSGIKTIHQGSSYSCRRIAGTGTPSQHSKGNAIDVMSIDLNSGKEIDVRKPGFFNFRQKSLLNNVRAGGCEYFSTVLGPGYNADHANHFHFDIMPRKNGYVACR